MQRPLIALALLAMVGSAAGWYLLRQKSPPPATPDAQVATAAAAGETPAAVIENPPLPSTSEVALPTLTDSDAPFAAELSGLGNSASAALLVPDHLIRHIVATIDNLPRRKAAVEQRPVRPPASRFDAEGDEVSGAISPANYHRYDMAIDALRMIDMPKLAALYKRFYPLFQRAYQDLGYPDGHFNERLIAVVDHLLATPAPLEPIRLVRPNVFWEFADPQLEALSAGQKLLIRFGPAHRAVVMSRLKEVRAELTR